MNKQKLEKEGQLSVNIGAEIPAEVANLELVELDDNVEELGDGGDRDWFFNGGVLGLNDDDENNENNNVENDDVENNENVDNENDENLYAI
jgi:hypothetical protein